MDYHRIVVRKMYRAPEVRPRRGLYIFWRNCEAAEVAHVLCVGTVFRADALEVDKQALYRFVEKLTSSPVAFSNNTKIQEWTFEISEGDDRAFLHEFWCHPY